MPTTQINKQFTKTSDSTGGPEAQFTGYGPLNYFLNKTHKILWVIQFIANPWKRLKGILIILLSPSPPFLPIVLYKSIITYVEGPPLSRRTLRRTLPNMIPRLVEPAEGALEIRQPKNQ